MTTARKEIAFVKPDRAGRMSKHGRKICTAARVESVCATLVEHGAEILGISDVDVDGAAPGPKIHGRTADGRVDVELHDMVSTPDVHWSARSNSYVLVSTDRGGFTLADGRKAALVSVNGAGEVRWDVQAWSLEHAVKSEGTGDAGIWSRSDSCEQLTAARHFGIVEAAPRPVDVPAPAEWPATVHPTDDRLSVPLSPRATTTALKASTSRAGVAVGQVVRAIRTEQGLREGHTYRVVDVQPVLMGRPLVVVSSMADELMGVGAARVEVKDARNVFGPISQGDALHINARVDAYAKANPLPASPLPPFAEPGFVVPGVDGRSFYVRTVFAGMKYGLDDCLTHSGADPLIEFYDLKQRKPGCHESFTVRGQYVARYNASTLAKISGPSHALALHGGIPAWTVTADGMRTVEAWAAVVEVRS